MGDGVPFAGDAVTVISDEQAAGQGDAPGGHALACLAAARDFRSSRTFATAVLLNRKAPRPPGALTAGLSSPRATMRDTADGVTSRYSHTSCVEIKSSVDITIVMLTHNDVICLAIPRAHHIIAHGHNVVRTCRHG